MPEVRCPLAAPLAVEEEWEKRPGDKTDPGETRDVRAEHPEIAARLQRVLDAWIAEHPDEQPAERSNEQLEAMRALGYIE